jgi:hypothetical protein
MLLCNGSRTQPAKQRFMEVNDPFEATDAFALQDMAAATRMLNGTLPAQK